MSTKALGYAAKHSFSQLKSLASDPPAPRSGKVQINVLGGDVCHSDIHQVESDWSTINYPRRPGHEIVGRASQAGGAVTRHKVGDLVGVGCVIDSCRKCEPCHGAAEHRCEGHDSRAQKFVLPVDSPDEDHAIASTIADAASWPGKVANGRPVPVAFMAVHVSLR